MIPYLKIDIHKAKMDNNVMNDINPIEISEEQTEWSISIICQTAIIKPKNVLQRIIR